MSNILDPGNATLQQVAAELLRLRERIEDLEDLRDLNMAIERNGGKAGVAWDIVCQEFGWEFERGN